MPELPDPDAPPADGPAAFEPMVEALLKHPVGSREYERALRDAGPLEVAEARRQLRQTLRWEADASAERRRRMAELRRRYPGIEDATD